MVSRAEHRRNTLLLLGEAAVDLFEEHGVSVTIEAIAHRAGVSRRTVFRWVSTKEELAFVHPIVWLDVFEDALTDLDAGLADRLGHASRAIALHIDADPDPPRRAFSATTTNPDLAKGYSSIFQQWIDRITAEVLSSVEDPNVPAIRFRARIIASAMMGMVDAVTREWVFAPATTSFTSLYDDGFKLLAPLLNPPDQFV